LSFAHFPKFSKAEKEIIMAGKLRILKLDNYSDVKREFDQIGVDPAGIHLMVPKAFQLNIRVSGLSSPAALILKQEMLSLGGDCANHRLILKNEVNSADAILMGNLKEFQRLIPKLKNQPFGLKKLSQDLNDLIKLKESPGTFQLELKCKTLDLSSRTHIMGIINVTPDSFSDGGDFLNAEAAIEQTVKMAEQGADIIDIGAESTRPGADPVAVDEELSRLLPVIEGIKRETLTPISVDTYKSNVAEAVINSGADIINDISGLRFDAEMKNIVAKYNTPVVIMHIQGEPKNMQINPHYDDIMGEIFYYLAESIKIAKQAGLKNSIIIDPGIGFGKRLNDNFEILRRLSEFQGLDCPILVGPSRKSFIGNVLDLPPDQRIEGTAAAVAIGIQNGAHIVRVHDVKEMKRVCLIADRLVGKE
jgi:dihydropteroate synthase